MTDSITSIVNNIVAREMEKRGLERPVQEGGGVEMPSALVQPRSPVDQVSLPTVIAFPADAPPLPTVPGPTPAPVPTPDSSTFVVTQTLVPPGNAADVATVNITIEIPDVIGVAEYRVRWVTA